MSERACERRSLNTENARGSYYRKILIEIHLICSETTTNKNEKRIMFITFTMSKKKYIQFDRLYFLFQLLFINFILKS